MAYPLMSRDALLSQLRNYKRTLGSDHLITCVCVWGGEDYFGPGFFFFAHRSLAFYFLGGTVLDFFQPGSCV